LGIAESWVGLETGYTSYFKERCKTAKCGRNLEGLAVYIEDDISKCVKEISTIMKEMLWIGIREERSSHL
jgi:hypothetical protein